VPTITDAIPAAIQLGGPSTCCRRLLTAFFFRNRETVEHFAQVSLASSCSAKTSPFFCRDVEKLLAGNGRAVRHDDPAAPPVFQLARDKRQNRSKHWGRAYFRNAAKTWKRCIGRGLVAKEGRTLSCPESFKNLSV